MLERFRHFLITLSLSLLLQLSLGDADIFHSSAAHPFCSNTGCSNDTKNLADLTFCNAYNVSEVHNRSDLIVRYEGEAINVRCQPCGSTGSAQALFKWRRGRLFGDKQIETLNVTSSDLGISNARVHDSGHYVCLSGSGASSNVLTVYVCEKLIAPDVYCEMIAPNSKDARLPDWVLRVQCWWNVSFQASHQECGTTYKHATYFIKSTSSSMKYQPPKQNVDLENLNNFHYIAKPWCIPASSCNQSQSQTDFNHFQPLTSRLVLNICPNQTVGLQNETCYETEFKLKNIYRPAMQKIKMLHVESQRAHIQISVPHYFFKVPHLIEYRVTDIQTRSPISANLTERAKMEGQFCLIKFPIERLFPYCNYTINIRYKTADSAYWSEDKLLAFQTSPAAPEFALGAGPQLIDGAYFYAEKALTILWPTVPMIDHQGPDFQYVVKVNSQDGYHANDVVLRTDVPRLHIPLSEFNFTLTTPVNLELWSKNVVGQQAKGHSTLAIQETSTYNGIRYAVARRRRDAKFADILWAFDDPLQKHNTTDESFARLFSCTANAWESCTSGPRCINDL